MKKLLLFACLFSITFVCVRPEDSCSNPLVSIVLSTLNVDGLNCVSAWKERNFILRYKQTATSLWTFVLSTPDNASWVAMGFSGTGKMGNASAVVGWPTSEGGVIKQYYLKGYTPDAVLPDQGNLNLGNMTIVSVSSTLYLAFQLKVDTPEPKVIFAIGPQGAIPSSNGTLKVHIDDYSSTLSYNGTGNGNKKNHGARNCAVSQMTYNIVLGLLALAILWRR